MHLVLSGEVLVIAVEQVRTMPALRRAVVFTESGMQGFEEKKFLTVSSPHLALKELSQ